MAAVTLDADITDDDKAKARKQWREDAPPRFRNLLDAKPVEGDE